MLDLVVFFFIDHLGAVRPGDVEGVHGGAFFGADAGVHGGEAEFADGEEEVVQQADAVECLNLHGSTGGADVIGDMDPGGEGDAAFRAVGAQQVAFGLEVFFRVVISEGIGVCIDGTEGFQHAFAISLRGDGFVVDGADLEEVAYDAVRAGVDVGADDVDLMSRQGAADLFKQERAVPGGDQQLGIGEVVTVDPAHLTLKGSFGGSLIALEEGLHGFDVNGDIAWFAESEVGIRHALEVLFHLLMVGRAEVFAAALEQFDFVFAERGLELLFAFLEPEPGGFIELEDQGFLPW